MRISCDDQPDRGTVTVSDDAIGYTLSAKRNGPGIGLVQRLMQQVHGSIQVAVRDGTTWGHHVDAAVSHSAGMVMTCLLRDGMILAGCRIPPATTALA